MPATANPALPLDRLYETDETAWLDEMAALAQAGRAAEMDLPNLIEFLTSMAERDRREVTSRLIVLLTHLLKWEHQPEKRTRSWSGTISTQRTELDLLLQSGTLARHARAILSEAYVKSRQQAAVETGLPRDRFPAECEWTLETALADPDDTA